MQTAPSPPTSAATVLLLRDGSAGPEVYVQKRPHGNTFTEGALVFVGGRVVPEDADEALVELADRQFDFEGAARRLRVGDIAIARALYFAAIRVTFESAGILIAAGRGDDLRLAAAALQEAHTALSAGRASFKELLSGLISRPEGAPCPSLVLRPGELHYVARWITPPEERRRFDTRFFTCRLPPAQEPRHEPHRALSAGWFNICELLEAQRAERLKLAPPTLCVLADLAHAQDVAQALLLTPTAPATIRPKLVGEGSAQVVLLPGDGAYGDARDPAARNRVVRVGDHWELERRPV